jgi:hypothetical protein
MKHKRLRAVALAVTVGAVGVGSAMATPGSGIVSAPILARGTLEADQGHARHQGNHGHHKPKWNTRVERAAVTAPVWTDRPAFGEKI